MIEHLIVNGEGYIYPAARAQIVAIVQDAQPEGVEIGLPRDLSAIDLTAYGVFPVVPVAAPETQATEVAQRDGVEQVEGEWRWKWQIVPASPEVPASVSMRQARLVLHSAGLLDDVEQAIAAAGKATQIEWEYAKEVQRNSPLIASLGAALGLSAEEIDFLFIEAEKL